MAATPLMPKPLLDHHLVAGSLSSSAPTYQQHWPQVAAPLPLKCFLALVCVTLNFPGFPLTFSLPLVALSNHLCLLFFSYLLILACPRLSFVSVFFSPMLPFPSVCPLPGLYLQPVFIFSELQTCTSTQLFVIITWVSNWHLKLNMPEWESLTHHLL